MEIIEQNKVSRRSPEVVVYVGPKKKAKASQRSFAKKSNEEITDEPEVSRKSQVVTMHRARFEVHKFGISGFHKEKKEEANVQLAISLGAKPLKNKYVNYKELTAKRIEEKKQAREQRQSRAKMNNAKGRKSNSRKQNPSKHSKKHEK